MLSPERARQVAEELELDNWYSSLDAMLQREGDLDAVLIATPDKFHAQAVEAGRSARGKTCCAKNLWR